VPFGTVTGVVVDVVVDDGLAELAVVEVVATLVPGVVWQTCVPAAASLVSAASVWGPMVPSTVSPALYWKFRMAASVSPPSIPSTGPASQPTALRSVCQVLSWSLDADEVLLPGAAVVPGAFVVGAVVPVELAELLLPHAAAARPTAARAQRNVSRRAGAIRNSSAVPGRKSGRSATPVGVDPNVTRRIVAVAESGEATVAAICGMLSPRAATRGASDGDRRPGTRGDETVSTEGETDEQGGSGPGPAAPGTTVTPPRSTAQVVLIVAAAVLIPLGLIVAFLVVTRGNKQSQNTLTPQSVAAGEAVPLNGLDGQWSVVRGPDSWVGYAVGEDLLSVSMPNTAEGKTPGVDGGIVMKDGKVIAVAVNADMTKLASDDPERDQTLTTRGLETTAFPAATFTLTSPITITEPPKAGQPVTFTAKGDLTLHGVTKPVELALQAQVLAGNEATLEVVGDHAISFADFGIEPPNVANVLTVQDHGTLKIHLRLGRGAATPATTKPG
jgi:polyisoprenoid-binding protein YceI